MASEAVHEFTDDNFDAEVLQADTPVLVDFWAEWCMPCRMIAPHIDQLAEEFQGKVKVGKLDVADNQEVAVKFGVSNIPAILVFKDGNVVAQHVGALNSADAIAERLNLTEVSA